MKSGTGVTRVILDRWKDSVAFVDAFKELQDECLEAFQKMAGPKVQGWLEEQGYKLLMRPRYAEFRAYREAWVGDDDVPLVTAAVGGLYPSGCSGVSSPFPYLWVYVRSGHELRVKLFDALRDGLEPTSEWLDPETERRSPLGQYLKDVNAADRLRMLTDTEAVVEFAEERFPVLLSLEDRISKALATL